MYIPTYILTKLGEALYTHAKKASQADDAVKAVEYFDRKRLFTSSEIPTPKK